MCIRDSDYANVTADSHNGADQAMALDLLASLEGRAAFPVTPWDSMEAGLTVMAIDRAMAEGTMVDCAPMWAEYDAARTPSSGDAASPFSAGEKVSGGA